MISAQFSKNTFCITMLCAIKIFEYLWAQQQIKGVNLVRSSPKCFFSKLFLMRLFVISENKRINKNKVSLLHLQCVFL